MKTRLPGVKEFHRNERDEIMRLLRKYALSVRRSLESYRSEKAARASDLAREGGEFHAMAFITGEGDPEDGDFTGGFFGYPGHTINGVEYFLFAKKDGKLTVGLNLTEGEIWAALGAVILGRSGLLLSEGGGTILFGADNYHGAISLGTGGLNLFGWREITGTNLVADGDFEVGNLAANWTTVAGAPSLNTIDPFEGDYCLQLDNAEEIRSAAFITGISPGDCLAISARVRQDAVETSKGSPWGLYLMIDWYTAGGAAISSSSDTAVPMTTGKWAYFIFSGTAPATAAKCKIRLWNACNTPITRYADDVKLVAVSAEISRLSAGNAGAATTEIINAGTLNVSDYLNLNALGNALLEGPVDFEGRATIGNFLNLEVGAQLTISGGAITPTRTFHTVEVESGTTDNLDEIIIDNIGGGDLVILRPASTNDIVVRNLGGGGNIRNYHDADVTLKGVQNIWMGIRRGSYIEEIGCLFNIGTHVQAWDKQLDDLAACAVTADGDFIVGNYGDGSEPKWEKQAKATARALMGMPNEMAVGVLASLADDTAMSFSPLNIAGKLLVFGRSSSTLAGQVLFEGLFRHTTAVFLTPFHLGTETVYTTGALAGTTGTNGKFTISVHTDGKIYFENRTGATVALYYAIM
jgi:hypothetical protein